MEINKEERDRGLSLGYNTTKKAMSIAGKAAGKLLKGVPLKLKVAIIAAGVLILIITMIAGGISVSQADKTLNMTASGEEKGFFNKPSEEDMERALWDKNYTKEATVDYLEVIADYEAKDKETQINNIGNICARNGWDPNLSLANLEITEKREDKADRKNSDTLVRSFPLNVKAESLVKIPYIKSSKVKDTLNLLKNDKTVVTTSGLYTYASSEEGYDYIAAMPAAFGANGSRFMVTFSDGSSIRVIKAASLTQGESSYELKSGGVLSFIADTSRLQKKYQRTGEISGLFGKSRIETIDEIESEFTSSASITSIGERMLAAFSVYMDNGQVIKTDTGYVNQAGEDSKVTEKKTDYKKELKKAIKTYLKKDGHFYEIDFQRDENENILVKTNVWYETVSTTNPETGEVSTINVRHELFYVYPLLIELDIDQIAEEIFELDPASYYVNSGGIAEYSSGDKEGTKITVSEAIESLLAQTGAMLFDRDFTSNAIYLSGLGGQLEWPAPGYFALTSQYGTRLHPILKKYVKHEGIDIGTPSGSAVVAAEGGTVTYAGWNGNYGYYISIDHGSGLVTSYAHLGTLGVSKGQEVARGQQIAFSGNTGRSTGPHLHFEVKYGGATHDPMSFVR